MSEVIELLGDLAGDAGPGRRPAPQRGDVTRTGADTTAGRARLGWSPTVGLADGLRSELDWVRAPGRSVRAGARPAVVGRAS